MKMTKTFWSVLVVVMVAASPMAMAKPAANETGQSVARVEPLPKAVMLADNVVVAPQGTSAPAPQPAPGPVIVQPAPVAVQPAPVAVQPAPVVVDDRPRRTVHTDVTPPRNYMSTIFVSALMGGLAGALIGGAVYYLDDQKHAYNIAYWAGGGVLLGTGVGVAQVLVQENRATEATAMNRFASDPVPTYRLALFSTRF